MLNLKKSLLIVGMALVALMLALWVQKPEDLTHPKELKLSDFPEVFEDSTLIIIGDEASEIELQVAKEIADYLEKETGNKPLIMRYSEVSDKDRKNNLMYVIYGKPQIEKVNDQYIVKVKIVSGKNIEGGYLLSSDDPILKKEKYLFSRFKR